MTKIILYSIIFFIVGCVFSVVLRNFFKCLGFAKVIRCKNCKNRFKTFYGGEPFYICSHMNGEVAENAYCSYAEKK